MTTSYYPRPDSFPAQVCGFFANNPDEVLTIDDMVDKFMPASRGNIHTQLALALEAKLLKRVRNEDGDYIYSKGPALKITAAVDNATAPFTVQPSVVPGVYLANKLPPAAPKAPKVAPATPIKRAVLDLSAIVIRSGVPMPTNKTLTDQLVEYLVKLEVGQMFDLPLAGKHTLLKAIERQHRARLGRFLTRVDQAAQTIGVWCSERAES